MVLLVKKNFIAVAYLDRNEHIVSSNAILKYRRAHSIEDFIIKINDNVPVIVTPYKN